MNAPFLRTTWFSAPLLPLFWGLFGLLGGCQEEVDPGACRLVTVESVAGDTLQEWQYHDEGPSYLLDTQQKIARRFSYEGGFLVREEWLQPGGSLTSYRVYEYQPEGGLQEWVQFQYDPNEQWISTRRRAFDLDSKNRMKAWRTYQIRGGIETLNDWVQFDWEGDRLRHLREFHWDARQGGHWRLAGQTTFTYDQRPSPFPAAPIVEPWRWSQNPALILKESYEYLPNGDTLRQSYQQSFEYTYQEQGYPDRGWITDWDGSERQEVYRYICEPDDA